MARLSKRILSPKGVSKKTRAFGREMFDALRRRAPTASVDFLQRLVTCGIMGDLEKPQWRELLFAIQSNPELTEKMPARVIKLVKQDSDELLTKEGQAEIARARDAYVESRTSRPSHTECPKCDKRALTVEYLRRPTGPGHKFEEVCRKKCDNCKFEEIS